MRAGLISFLALLACSARALDAASTFAAIGSVPASGAYRTAEVQLVGRLDGWAHSPIGLWRTRDGGVGWISIALPRPDLRAAYFESADSGWIAAAADEFSHAILYRTQDGGRTWQQQPDPPNVFRPVYFFLPGGSVGWVAGAKLSDPPPDLRVLPGCIDPPNGAMLEPEVFHTVDGGRHWSKQPLPQMGGCPFEALSFRNDREGVAVSGSHAYYTLDGGGAWISASFPKSCNSGLPPGEQDQQTSFFFYDSKTGWLSSADGFLWKTEDGGRSWCELRGLQMGAGGLGALGALFFDTLRHGWMLDHDMNIVETNDSGSSWTMSPGGPEYVSDLSCASDRCWAVAQGKLYRIER